MRRMCRLLLGAAIAGGVIVGVQAAAEASPVPYHRQAVYDSGPACDYAGYYGWLAGRWGDYFCTVREPGTVELWVR